MTSNTFTPGNSWRPIAEAPQGDDKNGPFFDVLWAAGVDHRYLPVPKRRVDCYRRGNTIMQVHGYPAVWTTFRPQPTHFRLADTGYPAHQLPEDSPHFDIVDGRMIALEGWQRDDEATFCRLMLEATNSIELDEIAEWSDDQCKEADIWACSVHLSASDNDDIIVPPRPAFIPVADKWRGKNPITGEPLSENQP